MAGEVRKATIYDIAKRASVSPSTVAAVLNGSWQKRRVAEKTALAVRQISESLGYEINLQARALRTSQSGLIGMIVPMLDNRFFSSLAQAFESETRRMGSYPVLASTLRDTANEEATTRMLIAHNIDAMMIAGATEPDMVASICAQAGIRCVAIDLPGKTTVSVISDNFNGARELTLAMAEPLKTRGPSASFFFIGGLRGDHNTEARMQGFASALSERGFRLSANAMRPSGYEADDAEREISALYAELGRLPDALFVNSTIAFEGVARFLTSLPLEDVRRCRIGCFDHDPFVEMLQFPVTMVRQDAAEIVRRGFEMMGSVRKEPTIIQVPTRLIAPREFQRQP